MEKVLGITIFLLVVGGGSYVYLNNEETSDNLKDNIQTEEKSDKKESESDDLYDNIYKNTDGDAINLIGYVKGVEIINNKKYLNIDLVEANPDWRPGYNVDVYLNYNDDMVLFEVVDDTSYYLANPNAYDIEYGTEEFWSRDNLLKEVRYDLFYKTMLNRLDSPVSLKIDIDGSIININQDPGILPYLSSNNVHESAQTERKLKNTLDILVSIFYKVLGSDTIN